MTSLLPDATRLGRQVLEMVPAPNILLIYARFPKLSKSPKAFVFLAHLEMNVFLALVIYSASDRLLNAALDEAIFESSHCALAREPVPPQCSVSL